MGLAELLAPLTTKHGLNKDGIEDGMFCFVCFVLFCFILFCFVLFRPGLYWLQRLPYSDVPPLLYPSVSSSSRASLSATWLLCTGCLALLCYQNAVLRCHCRGAGMGWNGMGWGGMGVGGMGWDGRGWEGMGWDGIGVGGVPWHGMAWHGMAWHGMVWGG